MEPYREVFVDLLQLRRYEDGRVSDLGVAADDAGQQGDGLGEHHGVLHQRRVLFFLRVELVQQRAPTRLVVALRTGPQASRMNEVNKGNPRSPAAKSPSRCRTSKRTNEHQMQRQ